ncbi:MAG: hypothetical protein JNM30_20330 [Rhodospirillales bacterium]|nr:hypothetical protein [Rhodospirillales bacterium]
MAQKAYDRGYQDGVANKAPPTATGNYPADVQEAYKSGYLAGKASRSGGAAAPATPAAAPVAAAMPAIPPGGFSVAGGPFIRAAARKAYDAGYEAGAEDRPPPTGQSAPPMIRQAYAQGYAAGMASRAHAPVGAIYPQLPGNCAMQTVQGRTLYACGNTWFQPNFGANGVFYRVVAAP